MESESRGGARPDVPNGPAGPATFAEAPPPERHWWAIAALMFPLVFCAIVGVGVFLMLHRQMGYFKPAPSGNAAPAHGLPILAQAAAPARGA